MNRFDEQDFDIAALMEVCSRWPACPVPVQAAKDPLLERVRQLLRGLAQTPTSAFGADLVALIRHVLLRTAGRDQGVPWMRVPIAVGWPAS